MAESFARLLDHEAELPDFARYHFRGYAVDGARFVRAIGAAVGNPRLKARKMPWGLLPLIAPFNTTMRELIEMRPFWRHPLELDNRALVAAIGAEPHTPLEQAIRTTLEALGCLGGSSNLGAAPMRA